MLCPLNYKYCNIYFDSQDTLSAQQNYKVCSMYFEESQLSTKPRKSNSQLRLKLGALPSLNISLESFKKGFSDILQEENEEIIESQITD